MAGLHAPNSKVTSVPDQTTPEAPTPEHGDRAAALQHVRAVAAWYSEQIGRELRAAAPDTGRLEELKRQREQVMVDQQAVGEAGGQELARITAVYAARLQELRGE